MKNYLFHFLRPITSAVALSLVLFAMSCTTEPEEIQNPPPVSLETKTFSNLFAAAKGSVGSSTTGEFVKFSFSENAIVSSDKWDIGFRSTSIIVNGGSKIGIADEPERTGKGAVSIVSGTLESVKTVPEASTFVSDGPSANAFPTSGTNAWYTYNMDTHIVSPKAGKIFVVKTNEGKYAKFEILSYYKDAPVAPTLQSEYRYYTFRYVYQGSGATNF